MNADDQMPASATARDKDYVMAADSEADDEATLEEEEAAAQQEADQAEVCLRLCSRCCFSVPCTILVAVQLVLHR